MKTCRVWLISRDELTEWQLEVAYVWNEAEPQTHEYPGAPAFLELDGFRCLSVRLYREDGSPIREIAIDDPKRQEATGEALWKDYEAQIRDRVADKLSVAEER